MRRLNIALNLTFILAMALLLGSCGNEEIGEELWIIGWDCADWDQLDPMIARGELPNLAKLKSEGASGVLLSDTPMISPILWTSISTGKTPDLHGVTWFMTDAPDGTKIPVSSEERRVRTFWNIASEAGMSVGITGWWATWPAEPLNGFLISDAVAWHSFGVTGRSNPNEGKTWPWDLVHKADEFMPNPASMSDDLMTRLIHLPVDQLKAGSEESIYGDPISHLRQSLATTRGYTDLTLHLMEDERPRLMSVYYEGCDAMSHLFGKYQAPRLPWISQEDFAAYKDVVNEYWKWQDELLGELLAIAGPQTTIMILSDHGFRQGSERRKEDHFHIETADADHQPDGMIVLHGPNIKAGGKISDADIYDVTPTILYALGLAAGRDMTGHPLTDAFTAESLRTQPVQWVPTYETSKRERGSAVVQDNQTGEDLEKMLRSLGYIAGSEGSKDDGSDGYTSEQVVNLATVLMGQGRTAEAVDKLQGVLKEHPENFDVRLNLAQALYRNNQTEEGEAMYRGLISDFPNRLEVYEDLALALRFSGKPEQALDIYDQALNINPDWTAGLAGRGLCLASLGKPAEGEEVLRKAMAIDPRSHMVFWNLGLVQKQQGHIADAASSLNKALELEPTDAPTAISLSQVQLQLGNPDAAQQVLRKTLEKGGDKASLLAEQGALQLQIGKTQEALKTLTEARKLNRDDPQVLGNLGMAYAMTGSLPSAIGIFEELVKAAPDMAEAHAQLGAMQAQNGQPAAAVRSLGKAVDLAPENINSRMNLAYALMQSGDLDGAATQFNKAIELSPDLAHAYFGLGRIEMKRGNTDEGRRLIDKARELDPSLPAQ